MTSKQVTLEDVGATPAIYEQLDSYPWDTDREFQGGLSAILGPNPLPSQVHDLTLRARCFYLSRKKSIPISFDAYKSFLSVKKHGDQTNMASVSSSNSGANTTSSSPGDQAAPLPLRSIDSHHETKVPSEQKTAPYPPTFAEIVELITSGAPIPGIKDIPDTVLPEQATESTLPRRCKPWESELPNESEGTFGDQRDHVIIQEYLEET